MMTLLVLLTLTAQDAGTLRTEVEKLAIAAPWSKVPWKTCVVEAFAEAARDGKPVLLWALGGDPEGRC